MTQPLGNCPGCGADAPFEHVHPGDCPDTGGDCPEWACVACGAGVVMGTIVIGAVAMGSARGTASTAEVAPAHSVRAA